MLTLNMLEKVFIFKEIVVSTTLPYLSRFYNPRSKTNLQTSVSFFDYSIMRS